ncbi:hypothetical protein SDC9_188351 [bioreactor metagenome]|uniref:Uncharacterized protein n=1 Tax=bioreactor metagenome TaxID=1076179 RepID=A0A645HQU1_9ZZZZ
MRTGENKYSRMIEAVDTYLDEKNLEKVDIWVKKVSTKRLSTEQKILFFYNTLATEEENFIKRYSYSWTGQISELEFLATTSELKQKFKNDFLGKSGMGILIDIGRFRDYVRNELGRGTEITLDDLKACINTEGME